MVCCCAVLLYKTFRLRVQKSYDYDDELRYGGILAWVLGERYPLGQLGMSGVLHSFGFGFGFVRYWIFALYYELKIYRFRTSMKAGQAMVVSPTE
jgi:hypothetical protein